MLRKILDFKDDNKVNPYSANKFCIACPNHWNITSLIPLNARMVPITVIDIFKCQPSCSFIVVWAVCVYCYTFRQCIVSRWHCKQTIWIPMSPKLAPNFMGTLINSKSNLFYPALFCSSQTAISSIYLVHPHSKKCYPSRMHALSLANFEN